jgi:hypothetical protein
MDIAADEKAQRKDRIKAATSLVEHGGMAAPKGGVNVNVGVQVNGQQAQAIIASVHEARSARLSDIPPAMPDTLDALERDVNDWRSSRRRPRWGGIIFRVPPPVPVLYQRRVLTGIHSVRR